MMKSTFLTFILLLGRASETEVNRLHAGLDPWEQRKVEWSKQKAFFGSDITSLRIKYDAAVIQLTESADREQSLSHRNLALTAHLEASKEEAETLKTALEEITRKLEKAQGVAEHFGRERTALEGRVGEANGRTVAAQTENVQLSRKLNDLELVVHREHQRGGGHESEPDFEPETVYESEHEHEHEPEQGPGEPPSTLATRTRTSARLQRPAHGEAPQVRKTCNEISQRDRNGRH
jgi:chromosome segregation ATPase